MRLYFIIFLLPLFSVAQTELTSHVNPFIGTGGHGHTFPGAVMPFGMVQLSPDTRVDGSWDGCSGYYYSDSAIYGFSHTHLSGTGVSDWGDVLLMPLIGSPTLDNSAYASRFHHRNEIAAPGFYEVLLEDDSIKAELTVTPRAGIHRYTFPASNEAVLILDLLHRDKTLSSNITILDNRTVLGYRLSEGWASEQHVYFAMRFSKAFENAALGAGGKFSQGLSKLEHSPEGAFFRFNTEDGLPLIVKVGVSLTNMEGALRNLDTEAPHWDFEKYRMAADSVWNAQLSKITVKDEQSDKLAVFYSALYHCFIHPSLASDVDGKYRGRDNKVHTAKGFDYYSVFSLWDTYRALHPLLTILEPERTGDFIKTFLAQYKEGGRLPMWELSSNETDCMIGFHAVSVIADAMVKGVPLPDSELVFNACVAAAEYTGLGTPVFNKKGYLEAEDESESVSKTLEYAYDNWCMSVIATKLGKDKEAGKYRRRSLSYMHLYDPSTGFIRPRINGNWLSPFSPEEVNNHFTEANSWQYSFYAPHDMQGLIELHGGPALLEAKLDALFTASSLLKGRQQADVTGLVGQYAHGNEPSHHIAYLYNYVGKPHKTIAVVRRIMNEFYGNSPDGLIGNEDCGQMSAWYVFSALGMYPVCPGSPQYALGEPLFSSATVRLANDRVLEITSGRSDDAPELKSVVHFGREGSQSHVLHQFIRKGGRLNFEYTHEGDTTNTYGAGELNVPRTEVLTRGEMLPAPLIRSAAQVFRDTLTVTFDAPHETGAKLYYKFISGSGPLNYVPYTEPLQIRGNCRVKAVAVKGRDSSACAEAQFFRIRYPYKVVLKSRPESQYSAGGGTSLIDGIAGDLDWRKGHWLGFQANDMEVVVDLKDQKEVNYLSLNCLQDSRSWILFPVQVNFYGSADNRKFELLGSTTNTVGPDQMEVQSRKFSLQLPSVKTARYLKIVAKNYGSLPSWHAGKGGRAYVFSDELEVQ